MGNTSMTAYILVAIWIIGGLALYFIGKRRGLKFGFLLDLAAAFLGPFSIPLAFLLKPKNRTS
ncbi:hypothetical protein [Pseudoalteromonas sp. MTN2-4]|uniref:hypothetical protein n=1 Tax=Pseudoalteromonas sp. MTN2-4 TaxID=3056555 RepID=UPI0036F1EEEE